MLVLVLSIIGFIVLIMGICYFGIKVNSSLPFSQRNNQIKQEIHDAIRNYMAKYAAKNPEKMTEIAYIFANAIQMIELVSPEDIKRAILSSGAICAHTAALNILQNCAMVEISPCPATELISQQYDDAAYDLYNAINDEKLNKGFISKAQHEENRLLAIKTKINPFI